MENKREKLARYRRSDPPKKDRMAAGAALGHTLRWENLPVRVLSKQKNMFRVTIPKWLADEVGFEKGDGIAFAKIDIPGALMIFAIKLPEPYDGTEEIPPGVPF